MTCKDKPCHTCEDCGGTSIGRMDGRNAKELAAEDAAFDRELERWKIYYGEDDE